MPFNTALIAERYDSNTWMLYAPLMYTGRDDTFTVPKGYMTDFATVPNFLLWVVDKTGPYTAAAVVHDWLITSEIPAKRVTSRDTDGIFRRIMREEGTPFVTRWIMWAAVRLAALFNKRRSDGRQLYKDAPKIALVILPALLINPAAVLVGITRTVLRPLNRIR